MSPMPKGWVDANEQRRSHFQTEYRKLMGVNAKMQERMASSEKKKFAEKLAYVREQLSNMGL